MEPEPPHLLLIILQATYNSAGAPLLYPIILFIIFLICSGLVSASEVAFFSLGVKEVKDLEDDGSPISKRILALKEKPRLLLATILIANNFVNIAIVLVSDHVLKQILGPDNLLSIGQWLFDNLLFGLSTPEQIGNFFNLFITLVGVTFVLLLFGEAMPKIYATLNRKIILNLMATPLSFLVYIFNPVSSILVSWSKTMESSLTSSNTPNSTTKEDIDAAIDLTVTNTSETSAQEAGILKGIVNFGDISAKQIMHSRIDIIAIEMNETFKEIMKTVRDSGYSRLPVYEDDLDNIKGILYVKDLLEHTEANESFQWQSLIRNTVLFVPESKKIDELLREFQIKRTHMAIIVDEYGGTAGIATLEDIMEEVVGDIKDEFDKDEDVEYIKISPNNYIFEGKTLLKDVCRVIGQNTNYFDDIRGEADSLAGLILELMGQIPTPDKELSVRNITLKVVSVTKRRIEKISLILDEEIQ